MTVVELGLFYVSALLTLVGALGTVASKNPIRAAMSLATSMFGIAGLYLALSAEVMAAVQVIVYVGAVVVLFVFVIMILGPTGTAAKDNFTWKTRAAGAGLFAIASMGALILALRANHAGLHVFDKYRTGFGTVDGLGRSLFTGGLVAFELTGILLLVAIVAVMAIARARRPAPQPPDLSPLKAPITPDYEARP